MGVSSAFDQKPIVGLDRSGFSNLLLFSFDPAFRTDVDVRFNRFASKHVRNRSRRRPDITIGSAYLNKRPELRRLGVVWSTMRSSLYLVL